MVQYSSIILNLIGGPELSELTVCGAKELPELPNYLEAAIWNQITGLAYPDSSVLHLDLAFLRQTNAAIEGYKTGRTHLLRYVEGVGVREHRLNAYLSALTHFEYCLGSVWKAAELFNHMEHKVLNKKLQRLTVFMNGDNSDLERINRLNGVAKHFSTEQAAHTSAPLWISNIGLKSAADALSFDELHENVIALSDVCRQTFLEIPNEAYATKQEQGPKK
jgi:hypothetical protein